MCEKLNLHHVSKGQGKQRYIEVRKRRAEDKSSDKSSTHSGMLKVICSITHPIDNVQYQ